MSWWLRGSYSLSVKMKSAIAFGLHFSVDLSSFCVFPFVCVSLLLPAVLLAVVAFNYSDSHVDVVFDFVFAQPLLLFTIGLSIV